MDGSLYFVLILYCLPYHNVVADYECVCNYNVEKSVLPAPDLTSQPLGYMYEFDCKPSVKVPNLDGSEWQAVAFENGLGYVSVDPNIQAQICQGSPSSFDILTTTTTTTQSTTPTTTTTTKLITTPIPTTTSTTSKPTTKIITPNPTTSTITSMATSTTTEATTPKPTTLTTTPKATTATTTLKLTSATTTPKTTTRPTTRTTTPKPTTRTTTPNPTTRPTTRTTTPKPTTRTTTPNPTTRTTTPNPTTKPTTRTTTPKPTTRTTTPNLTTRTTTPNPTTKTTTPKPTTKTTTAKPITSPSTTTTLKPTTSTLKLTTRTTLIPTTVDPIRGNTFLCPSQVKANSKADRTPLGQHKTSCYELLMTYKSTWNNSESKCKQRGGHLVDITDAEEQKFVTKFLLNFTPNHAVWIGLNDMKSEGAYTWSSGSTVAYYNWYPGHSNHFLSHDVEDCVVIIPYKNGQWDDLPCLKYYDKAVAYPAFCEYKIPR